MKRLTWNEKYELLQEYLDEHNGEYPKVAEEYKESKLGQWVSIQRVIYNKGKKQKDGSIRYGKCSRLTKEQIKKLKEINFIWNIQDNSWEERYKLLKEYLRKYKGSYPNSTELYKGVRLGQWVVKQRLIYNRGMLQNDGSIEHYGGILTKEQIKKLNKINFIWGTQNKNWEEKYNLLQEYLDEHNGEYPKQNEIYKEVNLGNWVRRQRTIYSKGIMQEDYSIKYCRYILTKEEIEKLNNINFLWKSNAYDAGWLKSFNLLQEYLEEHNGEYPKAGEIYKGQGIGPWVHNQRNVYNNGVLQEDGTIRYGTSILTKEKIEKLNEINFLWNSNTDEFNWYKKYELLKKYLEENNGEYSKARVEYEGINIGAWIDTQRKVYNNGVKQEDGSRIYNKHILTIDQIEKLNEINFLWQSNTHDIEWLKKFKLLQEYLKENNGEYPTSTEIYKDIKLGQWVVKQRAICNNGEKLDDVTIVYNGHQLAKWQIEKLNEINFEWKNNTHDIEWLKKFKLLQEYLKEHNGKYPKFNEIYRNINIGSWVNTQRTIYNNGKKEEDGTIRYNSNSLTKEQIEKLNEIGFVWLTYFKKDYNANIDGEKVRRTINKKILYKLEKVLLESKKEIESKEDIKKIEEEFVKSLTMFD